MPTCQGNCRGANVRFEIDATLDRGTVWNGSIRGKKGGLHHRLAPENLRLPDGADALSTYRFGTGIAQHNYC